MQPVAGIWLLNSNHMDSKLALQHRRSHNGKRKSFKMGSWFFDLMYNSWFIFIFFLLYYKSDGSGFAELKEGCWG